MGRFVALLSVMSASLALVACSRSFRPEYHPQTATTYVQNVVYAHNVAYGPSGEMQSVPQGVAIAYPANVDVAMANPYLFTAPTSGPTPAAALPAPPHRVGTVASPGAVVVYGNVNGNIVLGR